MKSLGLSFHKILVGAYSLVSLTFTMIGTVGTVLVSVSVSISIVSLVLICAIAIATGAATAAGNIAGSTCGVDVGGIVGVSSVRRLLPRGGILLP